MQYKVGSANLQIDNKNDKDYIILQSDYSYKKVIDPETKEDLIYISKEVLENNLNFRGNFKHQMYNYQYDEDIIGSDFPIEYHILDHKKELLAYLKEIVRQRLFNMNTTISVNGNCTKIVYHVAYNYFILKNNSPILTAEQVEIVNKIHDLKMPISYVDELSKDILKMAKALNIF